LRDDASLEIVYVSDEEDMSPSMLDFYVPIRAPGGQKPFAYSQGGITGPMRFGREDIAGRRRTRTNYAIWDTGDQILDSASPIDNVRRRRTDLSDHPGEKRTWGGAWNIIGGSGIGGEYIYGGGSNNGGK
jgi:hypothetical protein